MLSNNIRWLRVLVASGAVCACSCAAMTPPVGVTSGSGFLKKSRVFELRGLGHITKIAFFPERAEGQELVAISDGDSVQLIDRRVGGLRRIVDIAGNSGAGIALLDIDQDGITEFLTYAGLGEYPGNMVLFDASGKTLWKRPMRSGSSRNTVVVADLNRDGKPEIYVIGGYALECIAPTGEVTWSKRVTDYFYTGAEVYNPGDAGEPRLLAVTSGSVAQLYDRRGNVVHSHKLPGIDHFKLLRWPVGSKELRLVTWVRSAFTVRLVVMDLNGSVQFEHAFPLRYPSCSHMEATFVRLDLDEPPFLAVLVRFGNYTGRAMLCVFALSGELMFEEHMPRTEGLLAAPKPSGVPLEEVLLVGAGMGKVAEYERSCQ